MMCPHSCAWPPQIIIWKEGQQGWQIVYNSESAHTSSVNSIAWAPHDFGLALVAGSRCHHRLVPHCDVVHRVTKLTARCAVAVTAPSPSFSELQPHPLLPWLACSCDAQCCAHSIVRTACAAVDVRQRCRYVETKGWEFNKQEQAHNIGCRLSLWRCPASDTPTPRTARCNSVSWAPYMPPGAALGAAPPQPAGARVASGGCDNKVRVWQVGPGQLNKTAELPEGHTDWVRTMPQPVLPQSSCCYRPFSHADSHAKRHGW